ncbi:zinc finger MYM-type protein 1-like [Pomacea canaliculata]|uniref:zinc finger MYM-type protein 1-like n=1 Tax=Pomacea canaliculata TaxID=400727 RepID=UPI000D7388BD|nr:zinc finger MYM-type protein 1-like [Pomacea canaliculata]
MDSKRLSGAQYRKRRAEKAKEMAKQEKSLHKYLRKDSVTENHSTAAVSVPSTNVSDPVISTCYSVPVTFTTSTAPVASTTSTAECHNHTVVAREPHKQSQNNNDSETSVDNVQIDNENTYGEKKEKQLELDYNDPATWSCNERQVTELIVQHGPHQVHDYNFPKNENKRRFSTVHYKRKLANGEEVQRQWLVYSKFNDAVFCFCCKLFSNKSDSSSLQKVGSKDWKNISTILSSHEKSAAHLENYQTWRELELRLLHSQTIDDVNEHKIKQEEVYWRQILERLIALVRILAMQNLALRGANDNLHSAGNGNFLKFVEYLALFDPVMNEHLRRIKDNETMIHYLRKDIQNELIQLLANAIKQKILTAASHAKYYSVILDCTPDVSHNEQMTMIIRFVNVVTASESSRSHIEIKEHFLGFVPLSETGSAFMTEVLLKQLQEMELDIDNLRGQGYDNGSNMKGKDSGVQKRIIDINPRAFFVPCSAHSLNLVVNDAAKSCLEAVNFFGLIQQIYNYFSGSTRRWEVLKNHVPDVTVKPLSETRWASRIDALKPLRYQLGKIYDALIDISENASFQGSSGNVTRAEAQALANRICQFRFVAALVIWYNILFEVNITSKCLQDKEADLKTATKQMHQTLEYLKKLRSDKGFKQVLADATEIACELEIQPSFEKDQVPRKRRTKRQFDYEATDDTIEDPAEHFKRYEQAVEK